MKPAFLLLIILMSIGLSSKGQKSKFFKPSGEELNIDTFKNMGEVKAAVSKFAAVSILGTKNDLHLAYYTPLVHQLLLVESQNKADLVRLKGLFSKEKYFNTSRFETDFDGLKEMVKSKDSIIALLGEPLRIDTTANTAGNLTEQLSYLPSFILTFNNGELDSYKSYDFTGAHDAGIGISEFHLNLSELSSEYVTGCRMNYHNFGKKRIKYIFTTVAALNAVGDPVSVKTLKSIGPIEPSESESYTFDTSFFSKIIERIKITGLKIQYFDGSIKIIPKGQISKIFID